MALDLPIVNTPNIEVFSMDSPAIPFGKIIENKPFVTSQQPHTLLLKDIFLQNLSLRTIEGSFDQNVVFSNESNVGSNLIGICLFLKGSFKGVLRGSNLSIPIRNREQRFKYDPHSDIQQVCSAHTQFHIAHLSICPEYFMKMLAEDQRTDFIKDKLAKSEAVFDHRPIDISPAQLSALNLIYANSSSDILGRILIETAILQILAIHIQGLVGTKNDVSRKVNKQDVDLLYCVRDFLSTSFLKEHSLQQLTKQFGINPNKLSSLFKSLFGQTIFEFLRGARMNHAKKLLQEGFSVQEVSTAIGYENPQHFATAFKKTFGTQPSYFKS
jgi:AraC family transcriptional activator of pyochelin receptor